MLADGPVAATDAIALHPSFSGRVDRRVTGWMASALSPDKRVLTIKAASDNNRTSVYVRATVVALTAANPVGVPHYMFRHPLRTGNNAYGIPVASYMRLPPEK